MQNKILQLSLAIMIGSVVTACSNNQVIEDTGGVAGTGAVSVTKQAVVPRVRQQRQSVTNRQQKLRSSVVSKTEQQAKSLKIAQQQKKQYRAKVQQKPRYKRTYRARRSVRHKSNGIKRSVNQNNAIRRAAHERYFSIKKEAHRKYQASQNKRYKKYTPKKTSARRKYAARKRSTVRRITPNYPKRRNASFAKSLSNAAVARTRSRVRYDGRYVNIRYPWGDVPSNIGVCTDVIIRSYRRLGIDLQKAVHEDMANGGFYDYPNVRKWGLSAPDKNIDHRRVYNLQAFFRRHGAQLPISRNPTHYKPGDLVTWMVGPNLPHIGIVVEQRSKVDPRRHMIVHNIADGPQMEDILFRFRITGHYRYDKSNRLVAPRRYAKKDAIQQKDYQRLMRELSRRPARAKRRIKVAQSRATISAAEVRAVLGR
jgi:uncharacterized protein YijF (DUF1287 family)